MYPPSKTTRGGNFSAEKLFPLMKQQHSTWKELDLFPWDVRIILRWLLSKRGNCTQNWNCLLYLGIVHWERFCKQGDIHILRGGEKQSFSVIWFFLVLDEPFPLSRSYFPRKFFHSTKQNLPCKHGLRLVDVCVLPNSEAYQCKRKYFPLFWHALRRWEQDLKPTIQDNEQLQGLHAHFDPRVWKAERPFLSQGCSHLRRQMAFLPVMTIRLVHSARMQIRLPCEYTSLHTEVITLNPLQSMDISATSTLTKRPCFKCLFPGRSMILPPIPALDGWWVFQHLYVSYFVHCCARCYASMDARNKRLITPATWHSSSNFLGKWAWSTQRVWWLTFLSSSKNRKSQ